MKLQISISDISWEFEDTPISIRVDNLKQALYGDDQNVIAVLAAENEKSQKILIFEVNGEIRHEITQPEDHYFNCLGSNRGRDLAVMSKVNKMGWKDWWFAINAKSGKLESLGEGR